MVVPDFTRKMKETMYIYIYTKVASGTAGKAIGEFRHPFFDAPKCPAGCCCSLCFGEILTGIVRANYDL